MLSVAIKDEAKGCEIIRWPLAITSSGKEMNAMTTERLAFQIRQCQGCGKEYQPKTQWQKYCSEKCRDYNYRIKQSYICQGCGKEFYPKVIDRIKYCSRECAYLYNEQWNYRLKNGRKNTHPRCPVYFLKCRICGKSFTSRRNLKMPTCSRICKLAVDRWEGTEYQRKLFIESNKICKCKWCGKEFKPEFRTWRRTYCSETCVKQNERFNKGKSKSNKIHNRIYQYRLRKASKIDHYKNKTKELLDKIYERDNGKCQLCGKKVDLRYKAPHRMSASLDHIIPLSKDGFHEEINLQLAHYRCNSVKGNRVKNQQLRLL